MILSFVELRLPTESPVANFYTKLSLMREQTISDIDNSCMIIFLKLEKYSFSVQGYLFDPRERSDRGSTRYPWTEKVLLQWRNIIFSCACLWIKSLTINIVIIYKGSLSMVQLISLHTIKEYDFFLCMSMNQITYEVKKSQVKKSQLFQQQCK